MRRVAAAPRTDQVPEPIHRANQMYVEKFLLQHAATRLNITLRFGWRASATGAKLTCSRALRLKVRASARLRALDTTVAPGGRVHLRGTLRGGFVPRRGKVVDLQAFDGGRWRTFATVRSHGRRFRASYQFSGGARGTFPMRARVRPDGAYPFALGYSPVIRVRVG